MIMASQTQQLHLLLIPLMSPSHLIPFADLAKLLAQRGLTVTIIMTPLNAIRFKKLTDYAIHSNLNIHITTLRFPCQEAGLPEGCESTDSLPSPDLVKHFFEASNMLQEPIEILIEESEWRPSCIISDICFPWTADVAGKFNIPMFIFQGLSCFTRLCIHNLDECKVVESVESDTEPFWVPNMPDRVEFTKAQLLGTMKKSTDDVVKGLIEQMKPTELSAQGVVINTFEELEPEYLKGYQNVVKKVWCIGPVSLSNKEVMNKSVPSNEHYCLKWLDLMKPNSVIYVCFGSLSRLLPKQIVEIGLGLKASNHPFIWIIRAGDYSTEIDRWLEEEKFEERVKGRGLVIHGWAPQVLILSHKAIGGFLTHCGWNSTLEGVSAGLPMITWPMFAEQFYNEKLIVQVLRIGLRIGVEVRMQWGDEDNTDGVMVKRDTIQGAVEKLMDEGEEGENRRKRARELGEKAQRTMEEGGSSYLNMTMFAQHIIQQL